jgi:cation diffusion facilitator family transporter
VTPDKSISLKTLAAASIGVAVLVLALKLVAWRMTGSLALFSDAMESIVNVVTAVTTLVALRVALKPADDGHPYGHQKAEYFAAVLQGSLILLAALSIFVAVYRGLVDPTPIQQAWSGLGVNIAAGVVNALWSYVLVREGRRRRSPALSAEGKHLYADVMSSIGVAAGLVLATLTGLPWLDPLLAAGVGIHVLWSGMMLIRESVGGLMDESLPPRLLNRIEAAIAESGTGAIEAHDLRSRVAGAMHFIEFHLVVPASMTVGESHLICDRIEAAIRDEVGKALITIHVEPDDKAKRSGVIVA